MKNIFGVVRSKGVAIKSAFAIAAIAASTGAHAALPAWATTMITDASDNVTAVFTAVGPIVGIAIGFGIVIKLVKRGAAKI